ncbi:MAG TPA: hypothetical protein V6C72_18665, partial [Chroococcales cyanobacterium]
MTNFLVCFGHLTQIVALWSVCGLGIILALTPVRRQPLRLPSLFLIAPVIGYIFLAAVGLARLNLLLPLAPENLIRTCLALSLLMVALFRRRL